MSIPSSSDISYRQRCFFCSIPDEQYDGSHSREDRAMALFNSSDRHFVEVFPRLITCNPFLPEWVALEREALGSEFKEAPPIYSRMSEWEPMRLHPNVQALGEHVDRLARETLRKLTDGERATVKELDLYQELVLYHLYRKRADELDNLALRTLKTPVSEIWNTFQTDWDCFFGVAGLTFPTANRPELRPEHVFAWFFQLRRAFYLIYAKIVGRSEPAGRLRGAVWQSIFTCNMQRYLRTLYKQMGSLPTLITGPSGTGKELVAEAVGLSRYVPFNLKNKQFETNKANPGGSFFPLNISSLAATLIESELFGHVKGSFTMAVKDRDGKLDERVCDKFGTVFLDEIGELDALIQVKLLRVLQQRQFQRLGENEDRKFVGKIIAATNRNLEAEMQAGRFREDFYYRLCADRITTPSLQEQLDKKQDDLHNLLLFIARKEIGQDEAESLATEVEAWIRKNLRGNYPWPGNFRELEQCVRNVMIRQEYEPVEPHPSPRCDDPRQELAAAVAEGSLTADELEQRYFTLVYAQTGS